MKAISVSLTPGSDPDAFDDRQSAIYADDEIPEITECCLSSKAPAGQCDYSWRDKWTRCIYCGNPSRLDR